MRTYMVVPTRALDPRKYTPMAVPCEEKDCGISTPAPQQCPLCSMTLCRNCEWKHSLLCRPAPR